MVRPRLKWVCELCGVEHDTEVAAQYCESADHERMAQISMNVNRWVVCSNPSCERSRLPHLRSEWVPRNVEDRPWRSYACPGCGSAVAEYVRRETSVETPELDRAMDSEVGGGVAVIRQDGGVIPQAPSPARIPPPPGGSTKPPRYRPGGETGGRVTDIDV